MHLNDILLRISKLPWTISKYPDCILLRSNQGTVASIDRTRNSFGLAQQETDARYIAHVCSVVPEVVFLMRQALNSNEDNAQYLQNAYTLLTQIEKKEESKAARTGVVS